MDLLKLFLLLQQVIGILKSMLKWQIAFTYFYLTFALL